MTSRRSPVRRALLAAIAFYSRAISPALPPRCRFYPSCSAYAAEAVELHGAARGSWLALRRLLTCAPWHPGGVDLVPGTERSHHSSSTPETPAASPAPALARATSPAPRRTLQEESSVA